MMLGFLLARSGVDVVVLEKYPDFFRDFRGDTVHPSTLEVMYELGLIGEFLKLPHQKVETLTGQKQMYAQRSTESADRHEDVSEIWMLTEQFGELVDDDE